MRLFDEPIQTCFAGCEVYFNLHKRLFSVRHRGEGKVFTHARTVTLCDVTYNVQPAGRAKVLLEKKKNVHAFVRAKTTHPHASHDWFDDEFYTRIVNKLETVRYNPYEADSFVDGDGVPVYESKVAYLGLDNQNKPYIKMLRT